MATFHPSPTKPKLEPPRGACDTHFHVFGPRGRFPFAENRSYTPEGDAPKETLFALHSHLGIERGVVVQSAAHGYDNAASADLIRAGKGNYAGVALIPTNISEEELSRTPEAAGGPKCWVKVSGSERASRRGSPWSDAVPFARKLVAECAAGGQSAPTLQVRIRRSF